MATREDVLALAATFQGVVRLYHPYFRMLVKVPVTGKGNPRWRLLCKVVDLLHEELLWEHRWNYISFVVEQMCYLTSDPGVWLKNLASRRWIRKYKLRFE